MELLESVEFMLHAYLLRVTAGSYIICKLVYPIFMLIFAVLFTVLSSANTCKSRGRANSA